MRNLIITILIISLAQQYAAAQVQLSPKYSVDGEVKALARRGDTLIAGGSFSFAGIYTGGAALFSSASHTPNGNFPKIIGSLYCSTPDGNGGFYIYGIYRRESEPATASSARIEHVLPNFTFEAGFSLAVDALFRLNTILYHNGVLYIGGEYVNQIAGQNAGNLSAVDVATKQLLPWIPAVNGQVSGLFARHGRLYVTGSFTSIGGQARNGLAAIEINTGSINPWDPPLGGGYSDIKFYKDKIIIGGGFHDAVFNNHACALVDSVSGAAVQYVFNSSNLYWAAGISKIAVRGDTLFTFSTGTADTRVTAVRLTDNAIVWKKYFNMIASASALEVIDTSLFITGDAFSEIYNTNATNSNPADIERNIRGAVKLNVHSGNLEQWFPDPVGTITSDVRTMSVAGSNVFIGGNFSHVNGQERYGILMLNAATGELLPFNMGLDYFSKDVNALKLMDSTLYMAGNFTKPYTASVIACNVRTGQILPWHSADLGNAWALEANNKYLFAAGALSDGGGRTNLFAIDRQTGTLANWWPNPDGYVGSQSLHLSKGRLYVGGSFNNISGQQRHGIVSYDTIGLSLTAWQPVVSGNVTSISSTDTAILIGASVYKGNGAFTKIFAGCSPLSGNVTIDPIGSNTASGQVNDIIVKGRFIILGGVFTINGSPCNNLAMYDLVNKTLVPDNTFCQSFSNGGIIKAMSLANDELYIGGNVAELNGRLKASNIERIKYPSGYFDGSVVADTIYTFYPRSGGNGGDVTVNFYGPVIQPGMKVKLVAAGLPDIIVPDTAVFFTAGQQMKARIDLRKKNIGDYDVVLTTVTGKEYRTQKGFKITQFLKPEIKVQVLGPDIVRTARATTFVIQVNNNGNCDAIGVPLFLYVSANVTLKPNSKFTGLDGRHLDTLTYAVFDKLYGQPANVKAYWLMVPRIAAGSVTNILADIVSNNINEQVSIRAVVNSPLFASPLPDEKWDCYDAMFNWVADRAVDVFETLGAPFIGCANGARSVFNTVLKVAYDNPVLNDVEVVDFGSDVAGMFLGCATAFIPQARLLRLAYGALQGGINGFGAGIDYSQMQEKCKDVADPLGINSVKNFISRNSVDPNDKTGIGVTAKHYVTGKAPFQYGIRFENLATASLPAQVVKITDTLDKASLDLSTFQLTLFSIGGKYFSVDPGQRSRTERIDLRPQTNLLLQVSAALNENTGVFTAEFISLDPVTLLPITDPLSGFLPPNVHSPEGEGAIYFSIQPKAGLPNRSVVNNKALIWFDANAAITTPVWSNTIDIAAPISKANAFLTNDTAIRLTWSGIDGESGIEYYDVYYAVNGGWFRPLLRHTNQKTATFIGEIDSSYAFYSVAVDSVGNEEQKHSADAKVTIASDEIKIYPNPGNGTFIVYGEAANPQLYDMQGREIPIGYARLNNGLRVTVRQSVPSGLYVLKVKTNGKTTGKKVMLVMH